jgi:hypothetical protein
MSHFPPSQEGLLNRLCSGIADLDIQSKRESQRQQEPEPEQGQQHQEGQPPPSPLLAAAADTGEDGGQTVVVAPPRTEESNSAAAAETQMPRLLHADTCQARYNAIRAISLLETTQALVHNAPSGLSRDELARLPEDVAEKEDEEAGEEKNQEGADDDKDEEAATCSVCLLDMESGKQLRVLPCHHKFHAVCAAQWLAQRPTCPLCRALVPSAASRRSRSARG